MRRMSLFVMFCTAIITFVTAFRHRATFGDLAMQDSYLEAHKDSSFAVACILGLMRC